jgi:uncharacterized protein (TIGR02246 family)
MRSEMPNRFLTLFFASLALAFCLLIPACRKEATPAKAAATPPDAAEVEAIAKLRESFLKAHNDGNVDRLMELFTDDAVLIPAEEATCEGKEEIAAYFSDLLEENPATLEFDVQEDRILSDWAFERIDVTLVTTDPVTREEIEVWVRYLWILKRDAPGSWKIARLIFNTDDSDSKEEGKDLAPKT